MAAASTYEAAINRSAVVSRHDVLITAATSRDLDVMYDVLTVGNGAIAFNVDITGLQTFNASYTHLGTNTFADWGWHSTPWSAADPTFAMRAYNFSYYSTPTDGHGGSRQVPYLDARFADDYAVAAWLNANPHRLNLGQLSLRLQAGGYATTHVDLRDISNASQALRLYTGALESNFTLAAVGRINVLTAVHPDVDVLSASVICPDGPCPLALRLAFPYGAATSNGAAWAPALDSAHTTVVSRNSSNGVTLLRVLDGDSYRVDCSWPIGTLVLLRIGPHVFDLLPTPLGEPLAAGIAAQVSCLLSPTAGEGGALRFPVGSTQPWMRQKTIATQALLDTAPDSVPLPVATLAVAAVMWAAHWEGGAFLDLAGRTTDPNAYELERRVILSQYLLRANDAGASPPQETGLLVNSWDGKFHQEMRLWHQAHWALWGRAELLARSDGFYFDSLQNASAYASFEGYPGAHWSKCEAPVSNRSAGGLTVPWLGLDHAPWPFGGEPNGTLLAWESVGWWSLLIWQQPHLIFMADLQRRAANATSAGAGGPAAAAALVAAQAPLVLASADYLAARVFFNESAGVFMLGPPVMGGAEQGDFTMTFNPVFEVVYLAYALDIANDWREMLGLPRDPHYDNVSSNMAALHTDPAPPDPPGVPLYTFDDGCVCQFLKNGTRNAACPPAIVPSPKGSNCKALSGHPLQLGILGMVNGRRFGDKYGVSVEILNATLGAVWSRWPEWTAAWGWDDAVIAMAMARTGWAPESIVGINGPLLDTKFPFYRNGHTLCCPVYLPGNGGLLLAMAMLAAGSDTSPPLNFPAAWNVLAEGFDVPYP
jgi:hypothetical protein